MSRTHAAVLLIVAALCLLAYAPLFTQPLLQDDYPNIEMARVYGPVSGWPGMLADGIFRYRATFWILTYWTDRLFGGAPAAFYSVALGLHILCCWLVYALGAWRVIGWRVSAVAAAFFAVYEGHQEAVMWYSAIPESLQFLFGVASLICWVRFVEKGAGRLWYAASLVLFALALGSKESAVVFAALLLLPLWLRGRSWRGLALWIPFAAMAGAETLMVAASSDYSFRFRDGSFSPTAPFWITLPVSFGRLLWVWGALSLAAVIVLRAKHFRRLSIAAVTWIPIALLPYSFLVYMHRIPSRQIYVASLGLAWISAAGFWAVYARLYFHRKLVTAALIAIVLGVNIGYLWTRKRQQFLQRAAPTEALVALSRKTNGPIYMRCYPGPPLVYEAALRLRRGASAPPLLWKQNPAAPSAAAEFCWEKR